MGVAQVSVANVTAIPNSTNRIDSDASSADPPFEKQSEARCEYINLGFSNGRNDVAFNTGSGRLNLRYSR